MTWELSGEGQVQWTDDDWKAFHYAREAGFDRWQDLGVAFDGAWTGEQVLAATVALNLVEAALGGQEQANAALGLEDGLAITGIQGTGSSGNATSEEVTINMAPNDPFLMFVLTHELGHVVGQHSAEGPRDARSYHQVWADDVPGWEYNPRSDTWSYLVEPGSNVEWCWDNSLKSPGEDFADTFSWFAHQQLNSSFPFGEPGSPYPALNFPFREPDKTRQTALMNALDDFNP